ncbi:hypothetical protein B5G50_21470 [Brevibacillus brevis]|uniref:hypothetical protein n=1 Tax=Brevibacillus brevis TaxID=1393 RepID=UPI000B3741FA|nr:hypothetical protein [Brevibacillus brevis]OUQ86505.1 hypothetical protein B5G50_21470 [Brevibacillus brevis]
MKYNLESYFKSFLNNSIVEEKVNHYHNLNKLIRQYQKTLFDFETRTVYTFSETPEVFKQKIFFDDIGLDSHYVIEWDIEKAKRVIRSLQLQPQLTPVSELYPHIVQNEVTQEHLEVALINKEPVIAVDFAPTNSLYLIDGNHRITSHYLTDPKSAFPVYYIPSPFHINAMCSDVDVALYCIHQNLTSIMNYLIGNVNSVNRLKDVFLLTIEMIYCGLSRG